MTNSILGVETIEGFVLMHTNCIDEEHPGFEHMKVPCDFIYGTTVSMLFIRKNIMFFHANAWNHMMVRMESYEPHACFR